MHQILHRIGSDLLDLIAPRLCPACDAQLAASEHSYCDACRASLEPAPYPREIFSEISDHFPGDELALDAIGSLYSFDNESPVQHLIHALKYKGCYRLGVEMGGDLALALAMFREFEGIDLIVPVPLHRAKKRERGYNQAAAIACGMVEMMRGARVVHAIERVHHTRSQTTLDAASRRRNVSRVFRARADLRGASVLLCDDVCTTGATLNACATLLRDAGATRVVAATVAKDVL
jgi:ComF family protein